MKKDFLPNVVFSGAMAVAPCEMEGEAVEHRDTERTLGVGLKHRVISVRPLVGTRGRSRSLSSAVDLSTALYLWKQN